MKFVFIWVLVALSILAAHFGIELFRKFKVILTERICALDQISFTLLLVVYFWYLCL